MAEISAGRLAATAHDLMRAGQWAQALELLNAAAPAGDAERAVLAVAAAKVSVNFDFWCRTDASDSPLTRAVAAVADASDADVSVAWELALVRLQHDYYTELTGPDGPRFGPDGRDPAIVADLAVRAARLRESAPDGACGAAATFLAGLIAENLCGDAEQARALFAKALAAAGDAGDDETVSEALRHLGYWASQHGDRTLAREQWERSAELRQRAGAVPYVLAQFLLLADLARESGDPVRARVLAAEVRRWARALGSGLLESQAASLAGALG